eukprot:2766617-Pyramimonas_sp.AAC.1
MGRHPIFIIRLRSGIPISWQNVALQGAAPLRTADGPHASFRGHILRAHLISQGRRRTPPHVRDRVG